MVILEVMKCYTILAAMPPKVKEGNLSMMEKNYESHEDMCT